MDETFDIAWEQVRYWTRTGVTPQQALVALGQQQPRRTGWDDVIFAVGRARQSLLWGCAE